MAEKRVYNTKQRDLILRCIDSFGDAHFTAADVAGALAEQGITVGQATVYRLIDRFAESGELRKYIVDEKAAACYQRVREAREDCRLHFHLKCLRCGRLFHTPCEELAQIERHLLAEHGFAVDSAKTVFYGVCRDCRADAN